MLQYATLKNGAKMNQTKQELTALLEYATEIQSIALKAVIEHGTITAAAKTLSRNTSTISRSISAVVRAAAACGHAPEANLNHKVPHGFSIKRVSTLTNKAGETTEWVIKERDKEDQYKAMLEAWEESCLAMPKIELTPAPLSTMENLLCDYTIGDNHTGLYAWAEEAGADWDLNKSVDILEKAMNHLVYHAPVAEIAYILDVGDYMHADNSANETSHSHNKLDVDGRYSKVLNAGIDCIVKLVLLALQKHKTVLYRSVIGNHNDHSSQMLNTAVRLRFYDEPRLTVLDSPNHHHYYQFGCNLLADTHGHTTKTDNLPLLMATDVPQMWAETTNRVWRTGHVHHLSQKEYSGCTVVTYRTLAPKDAWHSASGYRSNREMQMTVYHKERGKVGASFVNPSVLGY